MTVYWPGIAWTMAGLLFVIIVVWACVRKGTRDLRG